MEEYLVGKLIQHVEKGMHYIKIHFTDGTQLMITDGAVNDNTHLHVEII